MSLKKFLRQHALFLSVVLVYLVAALAYSSLVPLGEAPDEPAHLGYARFIAANDRLPASLEERQQAGYRSTWPPLYHSLLSLPLNAAGNAPPTRLKAVGDTPRRLIPTNGQTIASFIHTVDEAWPWRGLSQAWHWSRLVSVILMGLTVGVTYFIALRLTRHRLLAAAAAAVVAFLPQALFIGSVVNDDSLLILLSSLILLAMVLLSQRTTSPGPGQFFIVGGLLGLATVTKYNAIPWWAITLLWVIWLFRHHSGELAHLSFGRRMFKLGTQLFAVATGAVLTGGWWFLFIWRNFNQVEAYGPVFGSLAAVSAGTADASLRELTTGTSALSLPPLTAWPAWFVTFFKSFWGLFGGGSTIELPAWIYWVLAGVGLVALISLAFHFSRNDRSATGRLPWLIFLVLIPLFFLPLPLLRFGLSGSIVETAQGRHLFPALPAISIGLILGLWFAAGRLSELRSGRQAPKVRTGVPVDDQLRPRDDISPIRAILVLSLPLFLLLISIYSLRHILAHYPPLIPLSTSGLIQVQNRLEVNVAPGVTLIGYEIALPDNNTLPLTLVWQADSVPTTDYLIDLSLTDNSGELLGGWVGYPLGGRYPTRAWDKGDVLSSQVPVPFLSGLPGAEATLTLQLLDDERQPAGDVITLATIILPASGPAIARFEPVLPAELRTDGQPLEAPFSYRGTLSFVVPGQTEPAALVALPGQRFRPDRFVTGPEGAISHFIVAADWPGGDYRLLLPDDRLTSAISNRERRFQPPPAAHTIDANFGDQITLIGYDLPQNRVQAGASFPVTLHLQARQTMGRDFIIFNHLLDSTATQRGGSDRVPQKHYTTYLWVPDEVVSDSYAVEVDPDAPPGVYWLDIGFYPADEPNFSLPLVVDGKALERTSVAVGPIKVGGPPAAALAAGSQPRHIVNQSFDHQITLVGFTLDRENSWEVDSRSTILTLFWRADTVPQDDYTVFVHLLNAAGELVAQADAPPVAGAYPTSLWDPGESIADRHPLPAPPAGRYTVRIGLYRAATGDRLPVVGSPDGSLLLGEFEVSP